MEEQQGAVVRARAVVYAGAAALAFGAILLLLGVVSEYHERHDDGGHGLAFFGHDQPWWWTQGAAGLLRAAVAVAFVVALGNSHRIVTGRGSRWWEYVLLFVPLIQMWPALRILARMRGGLPPDDRRLDRAQAWVVLIALGGAYRYYGHNIPWDDLDARWSTVSRLSEVVLAIQVLIVLGAVVTVVRALPTKAPVRAPEREPEVVAS